MNIINAIIHIVQNPVNELVAHYQNRNRANLAGDALENYIKDVFSGAFHLSEIERIQRHSEVFSYLGNHSNPPDMMLKNGDAIEVKKIESPNSALALNSSYPKAKLLANSTMISSACRNAENWEVKDLIYVVGVVNKQNELKHLCMVYGEDYCADEECYLKIKSTIKTGVESIVGVEFAETNELGRVNKIDPLGVTYLRVRGMWGIENPWSVFNYVYQRDLTKNFNFMCIINDEKWQRFDNTDELLKLQNDDLIITDIKIKNPNNPAQLKNAKLICYGR
ncbi:restriction endonuclease NgoPII [Moraxella bovoculi]|uniref:Restriction endonuclease NgoPII n=1 Tax=Moraxella bovoculi TaxID=386891 RepID=A0AAC8PUP1_9GAMM|nr:NgoPII family restriction endonuclease [Moraxella bovoculi]AKG07285.1 restriction endonuclease NgoPII [Moraxella bovoculi]AKG10109.1 restriction endonuclease NgoPII [Moraxella bovoculi]AKG12031.1 restriction endonuclease NgoPII [Moraxella bovoculi]AKG13999.1 restriction endonuclease NgoPII [Moraxella bovoculi]